MSADPADTAAEEQGRGETGPDAASEAVSEPPTDDAVLPDGIAPVGVPLVEGYVIDPIEHNGMAYAPGDEMTLTEMEAEVLTRAGVWQAFGGALPD